MVGGQILVKLLKFPPAVKIGIIIVLAISALVIFNRLKTPSKKIDYQTAVVEQGSLVAAVSGSGKVSTTNSREISTAVSGVVKKVYVTDGQSVQSGTKIADIELDESSKQKAAQAYASYQSAKVSLDTARATQLSLESQMWTANQAFIKRAVDENKAETEPEYIETNRDWLAAEAKYKNQQQTIAQTQTALSAAWLSYQQTSSSIIAPISGVVSGFSLQAGSVIGGSLSSSTSTTTSTTKIANIVTDASPTITIDLSEIDIPKIALGNKATITIDSLEGKTYTGKVTSIDLVGAVSSGVTTYPVVITLDVHAKEILPNMAAQANIITAVKNEVLKVPSYAVKTQNGVTGVQILKDNTPVFTEIEVGLSSDSEVEVLSGVDAGDVVITGSMQNGSDLTGQTQSPFGAFGGGRSGGGAVRIMR